MLGLVQFPVLALHLMDKGKPLIHTPFAEHLEELEQLLKGIAMMKELTPRTKDYLVSFGECMSTRIFAAYMNKIGAKARQVSGCLSSFSVFFFFLKKNHLNLILRFLRELLIQSTYPQRHHDLLNQTPVDTHLL
jgi:hypothetical protein